MLGRKHRFIIGKGRELAMLKWTGQNTTSPLIQTFTSVDQDKPGNRFNDGKADAIGRLWIGKLCTIGRYFYLAYEYSNVLKFFTNITEVIY